MLVTEDHRETPKALPVGEATAPTLGLKNGINHQDDVRDNLVDIDANDLNDCSAQEYEIMKVHIYILLKSLCNSK